MTINLISDTVTIPTSQMLNFMMKAEVGDDVFNADPTVIALQDKIAKMFGKEAALYFPSGTMANQTAIKIHTQPSEQMICDKWAHVYNFEGGGAAFNSGISCCLLEERSQMLILYLEVLYLEVLLRRYKRVQITALVRLHPHRLRIYVSGTPILRHRRRRRRVRAQNMMSREL